MLYVRRKAIFQDGNNHTLIRNGLPERTSSAVLRQGSIIRRDLGTPAHRTSRSTVFKAPDTSNDSRDLRGCPPGKTLVLTRSESAAYFIVSVGCINTASSARFGIPLHKIRSETSCLSVVQYNEKDDVVSGICLCNYPNVPSVPPDDWLTWLKTIYG